MERHTQRVKYLNALGRPCTPDHNHRNKPCVKKGPKKGHKEKHFGDNKKNYAPTDPQLYHLRVVPKTLASRETSRHHCDLTPNKPTTESLKFSPAPPMNQYTPLTVILRANMALKMGQGELSTR